MRETGHGHGAVILELKNPTRLTSPSRHQCRATVGHLVSNTSYHSSYLPRASQIPHYRTGARHGSSSSESPAKASSLPDSGIDSLPAGLDDSPRRSDRPALGQSGRRDGRFPFAQQSIPGNIPMPVDAFLRRAGAGVACRLKSRPTPSAGYLHPRTQTALFRQSIRRFGTNHQELQS